MHFETQPARTPTSSGNEAGGLPNSNFRRMRFFTWTFIVLALTLGAGAYWFSTGKYEGQAAETINASKETVMTNTLVGYETFMGVSSPALAEK